MIRNILHNNTLLAVVLSRAFSEPGIHFITPPDLSQQLGYMHHPEGKVILPHVHNQVSKNVLYTQKVLFIKKGKLRADFYDTEKNYVESIILEAGDIILLASGGHGFTALEEIEMIEVKQKPYTGENDKTRFPPADESQIHYGKRK